MSVLFSSNFFDFVFLLIFHDRRFFLLLLLFIDSLESMYFKDEMYFYRFREIQFIWIFVDLFIDLKWSSIFMIERLTWSVLSFEVSFKKYSIFFFVIWYSLFSDFLSCNLFLSNDLIVDFNHFLFDCYFRYFLIY